MHVPRRLLVLTRPAVVDSCSIAIYAYFQCMLYPHDPYTDAKTHGPDDHHVQTRLPREWVLPHPLDDVDDNSSPKLMGVVPVF
jgi:hypothetical protein